MVLKDAFIIRNGIRRKNIKLNKMNISNFQKGSPPLVVVKKLTKNEKDIPIMPKKEQVVIKIK